MLLKHAQAHQLLALQILNQQLFAGRLQAYVT
jgi:hypothetical protein